MDTRDKTLLFLAGVGIGGLAATYLVLRKNREKVDRAARTTRQVADQAERVAVALEQLSGALGSRRPEAVEDGPEPGG